MESKDKATATAGDTSQAETAAPAEAAAQEFATAADGTGEAAPQAEPSGAESTLIGLDDARQRLTNRRAPHITRGQIEAKIRDATYIHRGLLTICLITLENGYQVIGNAGCASAENYDEAVGRRFAHEDALTKIWPLEGYLLKQQLHEEWLRLGQPPTAPLPEAG
jgi:hypothetical protein